MNTIDNTTITPTKKPFTARFVAPRNNVIRPLFPYSDDIEITPLNGISRAVILMSNTTFYTSQGDSEGDESN
jgi:hypothetical protein